MGWFGCKGLGYFGCKALGWTALGAVGAADWAWVIGVPWVQDNGREFFGALRVQGDWNGWLRVQGVGQSGCKGLGPFGVQGIGMGGLGAMGARVWIWILGFRVLRVQDPGVFWVQGGWDGRVWVP